MMNYKMLAGVAAVACSAVLVGCGGQSKPPGPRPPQVGKLQADCAALGVHGKV